ncbi:hypothetical protein GCM10010833_21900 [Blastomonas aquatica]|uniref:Uncharacterized protein n=2 Tax=Blastomonas aquatica TaxID=1510276 RepID=A0ABQ1JDP8_9SPHN|nr:hypothetical protein GCM10010833_21900 [Blastomonas aquatica]
MARKGVNRPQAKQMVPADAARKGAGATNGTPLRDLRSRDNRDQLWFEGKITMTNRFLRSASAAALLSACFAFAPLSAQQTEQPGTETPDSGSMEPSPVTENPSTPEEQAAREAANSRQLELSNAQLQQNAANQAEYEARRSSYENQMRLYENTQESRARAEAEYAQVKQLYDAIHAQWEADVAACTAGNRKRCAQTPPAMPQ